MQLAAPPLLPADISQMFDEPIGLGAAPTLSSSRWLEQQQLAEVLEEQLTGVEAIEVSDTVRRYRNYILGLTASQHATQLTHPHVRPICNSFICLLN